MMIVGDKTPNFYNEAEPSRAVHSTVSQHQSMTNEQMIVVVIKCNAKYPPPALLHLYTTLFYRIRTLALIVN